MDVFPGVFFSSSSRSYLKGPRPCNRCGVTKDETEFYRRRRTGAGKFRGENARRGICIVCERAAYKPKSWKPRHAFDRRRVWVRLDPTKSGIREKLLALGYVSGSREYKAAYSREYGKQNPEMKKHINSKYRENRRLRCLMVQV